MNCELAFKFKDVSDLQNSLLFFLQNFVYFILLLNQKQSQESAAPPKHSLNAPQEKINVFPRLVNKNQNKIFVNHFLVVPIPRMS